MLLIHQLYNNILESHKYINKININKKNAIEFKKDLEYNDDLFPREIKNYIKSKIKHMTRYKTQINSRDVVINIYSRDFSYNDSEMIYKILLIINVLSLYTSKECSKNLHINIFLTPFKKMLPKKSSDILGPINVNSGFSTSGCINSGKITIYREEEWFKVLIHELFHNFNLDFATMNINKWKDKMLDIFDIQSEYNIYETYCETWARILNVAIISFMKSQDKKNFFFNFNSYMQLEKIYSLIQANKIYKNLKNPKLYRENSNVLCYYVFSGALMNDYLGFLYWCNENNRQLLKFDNTIKNVDSFFNHILSEYNNPEFIENLYLVGKLKKNKSLRMTIL
uniref:Peptidase M1 membrane alanine aminopeptidase domain-containing protein n=1 Tax=viral metagenome TaxID=1070528 RepID=A0A6C0AY37_9ZZZZ|tara:strand:+ start:3630 stop:4646 length:1017 start_codon:yes stop_codon:yes gene_type:complete